LQGRGDPVIREVIERELIPVLLRSSSRLGQECIGGGSTAAHSLRDSLALKWIHEAGGISDKKYAPGGRNGADHAHLEPTTQAACWDCMRVI
jgi:hypothetical protein